MIVKELDLVGKNLSNYKIIERLGRGGMATVYKAHEISLNRMVALKVLAPRLSEDRDFIKRFQREAQAAAKLNHPGIVQVYAIGEDEGLHYFAMEYVKGRPLSDVKKEERVLAFPRAVTIIKQVAEALGQAHAAGLIHRDMKPSNIMIAEDGRAKVTDFGIAYVMEAETKLTREGSIIGTPEYLSPEQCEGKPVDGRSDIYSLGVTLYEIISGKTPYEADTPVSMLMKIVQGKFLPLAQVNPTVPRELQVVVEKMMHIDPAQRYPDIAAVIGALTEVEQRLGYGSLSSGTGGLGAAAAAAAASMAHHPDTQPVNEPITANLSQSVPPKSAPSQSSPSRPGQPSKDAVIDGHFKEKKKSKVGLWIGLGVAAMFIFLAAGGVAFKFLVYDKWKAGVNDVLKDQGQTDNSQAASQSDNSNQADATEDAQSDTQADNTEGDTQGDNQSGDTANNTETDGALTEQSGDQAGDSSNVSTDIQPPSGTTGPESTTPPDGDAPLSSSSTSNASIAAGDKGTPISGPVTGKQGATAGDSLKNTRTPQQGNVKGWQNHPPKPVKQAPPNSLTVSMSGDGTYASLIESYAQTEFSNLDYTLVDEEVGAGNIANHARYRLLINVAPLPDNTLNLPGGRTEIQYSLMLSLKIQDTSTGQTISGPVSQSVSFSNLNRDENLQEAIQEMVNKLKRKL